MYPPLAEIALLNFLHILNCWEEIRLNDLTLDRLVGPTRLPRPFSDPLCSGGALEFRASLKKLGRHATQDSICIDLESQSYCIRIDVDILST